MRKMLLMLPLIFIMPIHYSSASEIDNYKKTVIQNISDGTHLQYRWLVKESNEPIFLYSWKDFFEFTDSQWKYHKINWELVMQYHQPLESLSSHYKPDSLIFQYTDNKWGNYIFTEKKVYWPFKVASQIIYFDGENIYNKTSQMLNANKANNEKAIYEDLYYKNGVLISSQKTDWSSTINEMERQFDTITWASFSNTQISSCKNKGSYQIWSTQSVKESIIYINNSKVTEGERWQFKPWAAFSSDCSSYIANFQEKSSKKQYLIYNNQRIEKIPSISTEWWLYLNANGKHYITFWFYGSNPLTLDGEFVESDEYETIWGVPIFWKDGSSLYYIRSKWKLTELVKIWFNDVSSVKSWTSQEKASQPQLFTWVTNTEARLYTTSIEKILKQKNSKIQSRLIALTLRQYTNKQKLAEKQGKIELASFYTSAISRLSEIQKQTSASLSWVTQQAQSTITNTYTLNGKSFSMTEEQKKEKESTVRRQIGILQKSKVCVTNDDIKVALKTELKYTEDTYEYQYGAKLLATYNYSSLYDSSGNLCKATPQTQSSWKTTYLMADWTVVTREVVNGRTIDSYTQIDWTVVKMDRTMNDVNDTTIQTWVIWTTEQQEAFAIRDEVNRIYNWNNWVNQSKSFFIKVITDYFGTNTYAVQYANTLPFNKP